jgi:hypothetical protein
MTKKLGMKYITRIDYEGQTPGYWVRVQRRLEKGAKPLVISQFFADSQYAGKRQALKAAKIFRDGALATAPAPRLVQHQPRGVKNGYGYTKEATLTRKRMVTDPKTKKRRVIASSHKVIEGWYRDLKGKVHRTKASIERWGQQGAQDRADEWLAKKSGRSLRATRAARAPIAA